MSLPSGRQKTWLDALSSRKIFGPAVLVLVAAWPLLEFGALYQTAAGQRAAIAEKWRSREFPGAVGISNPAD